MAINDRLAGLSETLDGRAGCWDGASLSRLDNYFMIRLGLSPAYRPHFGW